MADRARHCDEGAYITWDKQNHVECETRVRARNESTTAAEGPGFNGMQS